MDKVINIEEALKRIEELEKENAELREELEYYRNRKLSGRQKHNAKWMAIYNDFVVGYESGMTMVEIAKRNNVSERTIYRYKAAYGRRRCGSYRNHTCSFTFRTFLRNRVAGSRRQTTEYGEDAGPEA